SPNGEYLAFSGGRASSSGSLRYSKFSENGFTKGELVPGFNEGEGSFDHLAWSADSRYLTAAGRFQIEFVDMPEGVRLASLAPPSDAPSFSASFAPQGYGFLLLTGDTSATRRASHCQILESGVRPCVSLPSTTYTFPLVSDGTGVFYVNNTGTPFPAFDQFSDSATTNLANDAPGETTRSVLGDLSPASVLAVQVLEDDNQVIRRFYRDGRASELLTDSSLFSFGVPELSPSEGWMILTYRDPVSDEGSVELVLEDGTRVPVATASGAIWGGVHARHGIVYGSELGMRIFNYSRSTLNSLDLPDVTSTTCVGSGRAPDDRLVVRVDDVAFVLVNLEGDVPTIANTLEPSLGKLSCPVFSLDGESFAFSDVDMNVYHVDWPSSGPTEPQLIYSNAAIDRISILAVR